MQAQDVAVGGGCRGGGVGAWTGKDRAGVSVGVMAQHARYVPPRATGVTGERSGWRCWRGGRAGPEAVGGSRAAACKAGHALGGDAVQAPGVLRQRRQVRHSAWKGSREAGEETWREPRLRATLEAFAAPTVPARHGLRGPGAGRPCREGGREALRAADSCAGGGHPPGARRQGASLACPQAQDVDAVLVSPGC